MPNSRGRRGGRAKHALPKLEGLIAQLSEVSNEKIPALVNKIAEQEEVVQKMREKKIKRFLQYQPVVPTLGDETQFPSLSALTK